MNHKKAFELNQTDQTFDLSLAKSVRGHSYIHWTPIEVIKTAIEWLGTGSDNRILDIGSGVGKFCIVGALNSRAHFTGIETRKNLVDQAKRLKSSLQLSNIDFIHADVATIDFMQFKSFYFYNPFCEHVALSGAIDDQIQFNESQYTFYQDLVVNQFKQCPKGTKLVCYCSPDLDISMDFDLQDMYFEGLLQLWVKR